MGTLEHFRDIRLSEGLGQDLPGFWGVDIDGGIVMDTSIKQEPLVKAAQTAQLAGRRAGVDPVAAEMLKKCRDILLDSGKQDAVALFEELGKGLQVAAVGLAGEGPQSLLHAQIGLVVQQEREIARGFHSTDYPRIQTVSNGL